MLSGCPISNAKELRHDPRQALQVLQGLIQVPRIQMVLYSTPKSAAEAEPLFGLPRHRISTPQATASTRLHAAAVPPKRYRRSSSRLPQGQSTAGGAKGANPTWNRCAWWCPLTRAAVPVRSSILENKTTR